MEPRGRGGGSRQRRLHHPYLDWGLDGRTKVKLVSQNICLSLIEFLFRSAAACPLNNLEDRDGQKNNDKEFKWEAGHFKNWGEGLSRQNFSNSNHTQKPTILHQPWPPPPPPYGGLPRQLPPRYYTYGEISPYPIDMCRLLIFVAVGSLWVIIDRRRSIMCVPTTIDATIRDIGLARRGGFGTSCRGNNAPN